MAKSPGQKYSDSSRRMPKWDYSGYGYYFLTIVVQDRKHYLGKIENNEMILSDWGKIVHDEFMKSFEIRNELILDEYIFMPNHIHMIVIIDKPKNDYPVGIHGISTPISASLDVRLNDLRASLHQTNDAHNP